MAKPVTKYPARAVKIVDAEESHGGSLAAEPDYLVFTSKDHNFRFSYEDLKLDVTTAKNSPVAFTHPDEPEWKLTSYEHRILKEEVFRERTELREQIEDFQARKEGIGRTLGMLFFVCFMLGFAAIMGWYFDTTLPKLAGTVSLEVEQELAEELAGQVAERHAFGNHPKTVGELEALIRQILPESLRDRLKFKVFYVEDEDPDVFSLPNGNIFVFAGLLRKAPKPEGVAAVLARELVHLTERHGLRAIIARAGPQLVLDNLLGNKDSVIQVARKNAAQLIRCEYPAEIQMLADVGAVGLLNAAKIDSGQLEPMLLEINNHQNSHGWGDDGKERRTSTHLAGEEQLNALIELGITMPAPKETVTLRPLTVPPPAVKPTGQPEVNF